MAGVFPILKFEPKVQVDEKIRLDATQTFKANGHSISAVEITPDVGLDTYDVYNIDQSLWFLDFAYASAGTKTITLTVTYSHGSGSLTVTRTYNVVVVTAATDYLFSSDDELRQYEPDILKWLPDGYSSFNFVHRQVQKNLLDWFEEIRLFKKDGTRWQAADVVDKLQLRRIATLTALRMIFYSLSNQVDDVFAVKAEQYLAKEKDARNRNSIALDFDGDGEVSASEKVELRSFGLVRR